MEKIIKEERVKEKPDEKVVIHENEQPRSNTGAIVAVIILLVILLILFVGNPFGGSGGTPSTPTPSSNTQY